MMNHSDTARLCRSLGLLLHAGITPADGVYLLSQEEQAYQDPLTRLGKLLDEGRTLSEGLEHTGLFGKDVVALLRVGEETGRTEEALNALADYHEEQHRLQTQLRQAVSYPALLMLLMLAVIGVLLVKVLPVFDRVYASLGSRLTGVSAGLLHLGQGLKALLPVLFVLLLLVAAAVLLYSLCVPFRNWAAGFLRCRFGDRGVFARFSNARFARGLAMGLSSGLTIEDSVRLASLLLQDNPGGAERCHRCAELLEAGTDLTKALGETNLLDSAACRLLAVGIRGGNGDQIMAEIAQRMMAEAFDAVERSLSRIEPAMVLGASVLVGAILLCVMLPLMNILSALG